MQSFDRIILEGFASFSLERLIKIIALGLICRLLRNLSLQVLLRGLILRYLEIVKNKRNTFYIQVEYHFVHAF